MDNLEEDPISSEEMMQIVRKLWGDEVLDENGQYYPESSEELEMIYRERLRELKSELREKDAEIARLRAATSG